MRFAPPRAFENLARLYLTVAKATLLAAAIATLLPLVLRAGLRKVRFFRPADGGGRRTDNVRPDRTRVRVCIPDRTGRMLGHYFESRCLPLIASEGRQLGARKDLDFAPVMMANTYAADLQPAARDYAVDRVSRTCSLSACRCGRLKEPAVAPTTALSRA